MKFLIFLYISNIDPKGEAHDDQSHCVIDKSRRKQLPVFVPDYLGDLLSVLAAGNKPNTQLQFGQQSALTVPRQQTPTPQAQAAFFWAVLAAWHVVNRKLHKPICQHIRRALSVAVAVTVAISVGVRAGTGVRVGLGVMSKCQRQIKFLPSHVFGSVL